MDDDDIDCMVDKAKALPSWQDKPRRWFIPEAQVNNIAVECQIDWSKTYILASD